MVWSLGVYSPYWLFSQTYSTGSFQSAAMFIDSYSWPWPRAPSPKKATATSSVPRILADRPAPATMDVLPPTMPLAPRLPVSWSAMCMDPPLPPQ